VKGANPLAGCQHANAQHVGTSRSNPPGSRLQVPPLVDVIDWSAGPALPGTIVAVSLDVEFKSTRTSIK